MYTHSVSHAHFLCTFSLRDVQTRTRMAQSICSAHVISLHLTLSILMFHPPSLLFPHGYFDTSFPTLTSTTFLPNCSRSESAGQAHFRTSEEFGYLADPTHSTSCEPKEFDKITSVWTVPRRLSTIRTTITSLTSRKSHARTLDCSVFPQHLKLLFRTFLMVSFLFREKSKKACIGKPLLDREREKREVL